MEFFSKNALILFHYSDRVVTLMTLLTSNKYGGIRGSSLSSVTLFWSSVFL